MPAKQFGVSVQASNWPAVALSVETARSAGQRKKSLLRAMAVAIAAATLTVGLTMPTSLVQAQSTAPAAVAVPGYSISDEADLFMHYSLMGDTKLADHFGEAILKAQADPVVLLHAFESAANGRNISQILLENQQKVGLRKVSATIAALLEKGHISVARNPDRIKTAIKHMVLSPRAFVVSRRRLTAAGEFGVPFFIADMNNPADSTMNPFIVQMMSDIGKPLLNALVQALQTENSTEKVQLVNVLGNIGYIQAIPYIKEILQSPTSDPELKRASGIAIQKIDPNGAFSNLSAAESFVHLGWMYFYNAPSVAVNHPAEATNPVWYFSKNLNNVVPVPVPTPIWKDIQTMRACEAALRLDPKNSAAISLWLAANLRRQTDLPAGATDPTQKAGSPDANYYAVAAGPIYLNPVLTIALEQHNTPLILNTIGALAQTGGVEGLVGTGQQSQSTPLMTALSYPDPRVRFAAASALARANPTTKFMGWYRVPTVLGEAVAQTSKPAAILVDANPQERNRLRAILRVNYNVYDAPHFGQALEQAKGAPYIGLVVMPGGMATNRMIEMTAADERMQYAPVLVTGPIYDMPKLRLEYVNQPTFDPIPATADAGDISMAIARIYKRLNITPIDEASASQFSIESANLLRDIATNRGSIYNANIALPALVEGLHNSHAKVVLASAGALGEMRNPEAQIALASAALDGQNQPAVVQQTLLMDLAASARNVGDRLSSDAVQGIIHEVTHAATPAVRTSAAVALGALNVPSNQASELIRMQSR